MSRATISRLSELYSSRFISRWGLGVMKGESAPRPLRAPNGAATAIPNLSGIAHGLAPAAGGERLPRAETRANGRCPTPRNPSHCRPRRPRTSVKG